MREIKFRAWDKENKERLIVRAVSFESFKNKQKIVAIICEHEDGREKSPMTDEQVEHFKDVEKFELMQFTGLKDKNGKEIYEGDILKCTTTNNHGFIDEVIFESLTFCLSGDFVFDELKEFEVVGNKFENPELLK